MNRKGGICMRKYSTSELLSFFLISLLLVSVILSNKGQGPIYSNIVVISLGCLIFIKGRNQLRSKLKDTRWNGRALILISIMLVYSLFAKSSDSSRNVILVCSFTAALIFLTIWSKNASKKAFSCTLWLLFFPTIISIFILGIIDSIIKLQLIHIIVVFSLLYCTFWILMARYGHLQTTQQATIYSGFTAVILLMLLIFIVQVFSPIITQLGISNIEFKTNPLSYLGYDYKDLFHILIYLITFPVIVLSGVSYIITSSRKIIKTI